MQFLGFQRGSVLYCTGSSVEEKYTFLSLMRRSVLYMFLRRIVLFKFLRRSIEVPEEVYCGIGS